MGEKTLKMKLDALSIDTKVLKSTRCHLCKADDPNCIFSVADGFYHIVCKKCGNEAEGRNFKNALYNYSWKSALKSEPSEESLIDKL